MPTPMGMVVVVVVVLLLLLPLLRMGSCGRGEAMRPVLLRGCCCCFDSRWLADDAPAGVPAAPAAGPPLAESVRVGLANVCQKSRLCLSSHAFRHHTPPASHCVMRPQRPPSDELDDLLDGYFPICGMRIALLRRGRSIDPVDWTLH